MSEKYLIFGATGSIGSNLSEQLKNSGNDIHLVARNESEVSAIADKLECSFTVADVLEVGFIEKVKADVPEIKGIAKAHPLKRLGEGKDSASLAKFLITEDSSWVTGQIIAVDGGRSKLS